MFQDIRVFWREFRDNFTSTGAILPSSDALARAILRPLKRRPQNAPVRVLEVGPGTGAFTFSIVRHLVPGDVLHIYELNPRFYAHLKKKLEVHPDAQTIEWHLHAEDIRRLRSTLQFDYIISGLPFANFPPALFCEIMEIYLAHLKPHGVLSYFEYLIPHRFRLQFLKSADKSRLRRLLAKLRMYVRKHEIDSTRVWLNMPPARARHLTKVPHKP